MTEDDRIIERKEERKYRKRRIKRIGKKAFNRIITNAVARWRARYPLKVKAHRKVFVAIRNKSLKRKPCHCGNKKSEAHHEDYHYPLKVKWLCKLHHAEADRKLKDKKIQQNEMV